MRQFIHDYILSGSFLFAFIFKKKRNFIQNGETTTSSSSARCLHFPFIFNIQCLDHSFQFCQCEMLISLICSLGLVFVFFVSLLLHHHIALNVIDSQKCIDMIWYNIHSWNRSIVTGKKNNIWYAFSYSFCCFRVFLSWRWRSSISKASY